MFGVTTDEYIFFFMEMSQFSKNNTFVYTLVLQYMFLLD